MAQRTYLRLPVNADEGFPQSFRLDFNERSYQVLLYVNARKHSLDTLGLTLSEAEVPDDHVYRLPAADAFLVMRVAREGGGDPEVIFHRKLVLNLAYEAAELAFVFREIKIAKRNLNGVGTFGSNVVGGIAQR